MSRIRPGPPTAPPVSVNEAAPATAAEPAAAAAPSSATPNLQPPELPRASATPTTARVAEAALDDGATGGAGRIASLFDHPNFGTGPLVQPTATASPGPLPAGVAPAQTSVAEQRALLSSLQASLPEHHPALSDLQSLLAGLGE